MGLRLECPTIGVSVAPSISFGENCYKKEELYDGKK